LSRRAFDKTDTELRLMAKKMMKEEIEALVYPNPELKNASGQPFTALYDINS